MAKYFLDVLMQTTGWPEDWLKRELQQRFNNTQLNDLSIHDLRVWAIELLNEQFNEQRLKEIIKN
ncbi:MAG: hypothetical protein ACOYOK_06400 [Pseudobdellovibrionaceae bacterium]